MNLFGTQNPNIRPNNCVAGRPNCRRPERSYTIEVRVTCPIAPRAHPDVVARTGTVAEAIH
jgi:hypothetical protein